MVNHLYCKTNGVAEKASEHFECQLCDFISNWKNGLKVHMSRKHSEIEHYIDASEVIEDYDITDEEKKTEQAKLLDARKAALGSNFSYFPPWTN